jgi:hypothetical protein
MIVTIHLIEVPDIRSIVRDGRAAEAEGRLTHGMLCYLNAQKLARTPLERRVVNEEIERIAQRMRTRKEGA